jgi:twitching motility protein PilT
VETSGFFTEPNGVPPAPEWTEGQPYEPPVPAEQVAPLQWSPDLANGFTEAGASVMQAPMAAAPALAPVSFAAPGASETNAASALDSYAVPSEHDAFGMQAQTAYPHAVPEVPAMTLAVPGSIAPGEMATPAVDASTALRPLSTPPSEPVPASTQPGSVPVQAPEGQPFASNGTGYDQPALVQSLSLTDLLITVLERAASDLHLTAGARPTLRLNGSLQPMDDRPVLTPTVLQQMMFEILTQKQRERFEEELELDFAYAVPGRARFRVNLYRQREALGAAFRLIPYEIKKLEDLGVPPSVANFAMMPRGFVLVTGPTGSGKSTTLAGIIDLANRQRRDHIMTVEDPIEFLHQHKSCLINQREVGDDTKSFGNALKHVLRQDPDIILVGEMRDLETISVALTAAETGHLVFATLHTQDAAQTIDRVIDVFPPHQQQQVRVQLAGSLQGIVAQTLCKTSDGKGRVVATEVLVATPAIRNLIREGKTHQIYSALQAGARHGMHTMDQHLAELLKAGKITYEAGLEKCHHVEDFNRLTGRG